MKKLVLTAIGIMAAVSVWAQGTVNFSNLIGASARITESDTTTFLAGSAYMCDLYWGPTGASPSTFTQHLGIAVPFNTGAQAGFFSGGERTLTLTPGGTTVTIQVRAWRASDGATWQAAYDAGGHVSPATAPGVNVTLADGTAVPHPTPPSMTGYVGHSLIIAPEPSTMLMGLAGLGGLLLLRRKVS